MTASLQLPEIQFGSFLAFGQRKHPSYTSPIPCRPFSVFPNLGNCFVTAVCVNSTDSFIPRLEIAGAVAT